jgi:hypothetical protein
MQEEVEEEEEVEPVPEYGITFPVYESKGKVLGLLDDPRAFDAELKAIKDRENAAEKARKQEVKDNLRLRDQAGREFKNRRNKERFYSGLEKVKRGIIKAIYGPDAFDDDDKIGKKKWEASYERHRRKFGVILVIIISFILCLLVYEFATLLGFSGNQLIISKIMIGDKEIVNVLTPRRISSEEYHKIVTIPVMDISALDISSGVLRVAVSGRWYNVTVDSIRAALHEENCISATHYGIPLKIAKVGSVLMFDPTMKNPSLSTINIRYSDPSIDVSSEMTIPVTPMVSFTNSAGRKVDMKLDTRDSGCLAGLKKYANW